MALKQQSLAASRLTSWNVLTSFNQVIWWKLFNIVTEDQMWLLKGFIFLVSSIYDVYVCSVLNYKKTKTVSFNGHLRACSQWAQPLSLSTYKRSSFCSGFDIRMLCPDNIGPVTSEAILRDIWWIAAGGGWQKRTASLRHSNSKAVLTLRTEERGVKDLLVITLVKHVYSDILRCMLYVLAQYKSLVKQKMR